jgi:hypothetical protein
MPDAEVHFDIRNVNFEWAKTMIKTWVRHYNCKLGVLRSELLSAQTLPYLDLGRAKSTAIHWAKKNYHRKLDHNAISAFYDFIRPLDPNYKPVTQPPNVTPVSKPVQNANLVQSAHPKKRLHSPAEASPPLKRPDKQPSPISSLPGTSSDHSIYIPVDPSMIPLPDSPPPAPPFSPEDFPPLPQRVSNAKGASKQPGPRTRAAQKVPQPRFTPSPCARPKKPTPLEQNKFWKFRNEATNKPNWQLPTLDKKILIVGDSNLSRINVDPHPDTQVACFPGASINDLRTIINKYTGKLQPEKVVLTIGINDRNNLISASEYRLRLLFSMVRKKFPKSRIYFTELNFSATSTPQQKQALDAINRTAASSKAKSPESRVIVIPSLASTEFEVGHDNIHWTERTANDMYNNWLVALNLN